MSLSLRRNLVEGAGMSATQHGRRFPVPASWGTSKQMTSLPYESYCRVFAVLDELEAPELEGDEHEVLQDAAEGLLLTRDGEEHERDKILLDAWLVLSSLVRTGRWRYRAAEQMRRMLEACGPDRVPERVAALV